MATKEELGLPSGERESGYACTIEYTRFRFPPCRSSAANGLARVLARGKGGYSILRIEKIGQMFRPDLSQDNRLPATRITTFTLGCRLDVQLESDMRTSALDFP